MQATPCALLLFAASLAPLAAAQPAPALQDVPSLSPGPAGSPRPATDEVAEFLGIAAEIQAKTRTPGAAFAVIDDYELVHLGAMGVRNVEAELPATVDTMFAIGSCTKAFTGVLGALAVQREQLGWTDPIAEILGGLELPDPYLTRHVALADLMSHRTGLAGHNMIWYGSDLEHKDLIEVVPHLQSYFPLGRQYVYNNLMVSLAGLALESATGVSWHEQIVQEVFRPLGMTSSVTDYAGFQAYGERSTGYAYDGTTVLPHLDIDVVGPAGSIGSTARDMAAWLRWVVHGASPDGSPEGAQLLGPDDFAYLTAAHMVVRPPEPVFYGIGWEVEWRRGKKVIGHGGGIDGQNCYVRAVPSEGFGIVILANQQSDFDDLLVRYAEDLFVHGQVERDLEWEDRLEEVVRVRDQRRAMAPRAIELGMAAFAEAGEPSVAALVGTYRNPAYPPVHIRPAGEGGARLRYNSFEGPVGRNAVGALVAFTDPMNAGSTLDLTVAGEPEGPVKSISIPMEGGLPPVIFQKD